MNLRLPSQDSILVSLAEPMLGLPVIVVVAVLLAGLATVLTVLQVGRALLTAPIHRPARRPPSAAARSSAHPSHH